MFWDSAVSFSLQRWKNKKGLYIWMSTSVLVLMSGFLRCWINAEKVHSLKTTTTFYMGTLHEHQLHDGMLIVKIKVGPKPIQSVAMNHTTFTIIGENGR